MDGDLTIIKVVKIHGVSVAGRDRSTVVGEYLSQPTFTFSVVPNNL